MKSLPHSDGIEFAGMPESATIIKVWRAFPLAFAAAKTNWLLISS